MSATDLTGQVLGQYTITTRLGRGGMADVYKAFHPKLEVYRAIKVIRPEFVTAEDFRGRFQKEAQAVASLRHPNIVQIHDFGEQDDAYYMVMEFIDGRDLKHVIAQQGKIRPIDKAVDIVVQIAGALHYAHARGLIHRDIKPENIMLDADGLPILMDFGIAKLLTTSTQLTQTGMSIGTPAYMAPEQAQALPEIGAPADIYSLAIVLYEMLTGRVPFSADTPMAVMLKSINDPMPMPRDFSADISEDLQHVLLKGTAKDPQNRYATARDFKRALREVLDEPMAATQFMKDSKVAGDETARATPTVTRSRSRGNGWSIAAAVIVVTALLAGGWFYFLDKDRLEEAALMEPELASTSAVESSPPNRAQTQPRVLSSGEPLAASSEETASPQVDTPPDKRTEEATPVEPVVAGADKIPEAPDAVKKSEINTPTERVEVAIAEQPVAADSDVVLPAPLVVETIDGGTIQMDQLVDGHTEQVGQRVSYKLDGSRGQLVFFDVTDNRGDSRFSLISPDDKELFTTSADHGPVTLTDNGTYTVMVKPSNGSTAVFSFEFNSRQFSRPVAQSRSIEFGNYIQGQTTAPGQDLSYTFHGRAGDMVYFDLRMSSAKTWFTLTTQDGNVQVFEDFKDTGPVRLPQTGAYTLAADTPPDRTAQFEFKLWQVSPPVVNGVAITPGATITGRTQAPGQMVSYTLQAEAGEALQFDRIRVSETTDFVLIDPSGTRVFQNTDDFGPIVLARSGTWSLLADPRDDHTANFEFVVEIE